MWLTGNNSTDFTDKISLIPLIAPSVSSVSEISVISVRNQCHQCKGFSFMELMVTVVILVVGLVFIIQGFITAAGAINTAQSHIQAIQFLDAKMQGLEASAKINNGIKTPQKDEGEFSSAARNFNWNLEIVAVKEPEDEEELDLSEDLNEVRLTASWQERNQPRDLSVVTYLKNKKE